MPKMRALLFALLSVFTLAQPVQACRGPFSSPQQLHLSNHDQVFLGTVESITDGPDPDLPGMRTKITTFRVERAWQSPPPKTVSIAYVSQNVGCEGIDECVCTKLPVVGEKWLVVAVNVVAIKPGINLHATTPGTFRIRSERQLQETLDILREQRGTGFLPK